MHAIQILPLLSRGKHRSPRRGACFMELASFLAGERWSDHPSCTHRLLAHLARLVNDLTSDGERPRLATLVPSVIGLNSTDPRWDDELTLLAATRALPVVAEHHQRALAVGILNCERRRAALTGAGRESRPRAGDSAGGDDIPLSPASRQALDQVPLATAWAREFIAECGGPGKHHPGAAIIEVAVIGLSRAAVADPAAMMRQLLADAITMCERLAGREQTVRTAPDPEVWREVCRPAPVG